VSVPKAILKGIEPEVGVHPLLSRAGNWRGGGKITLQRKGHSGDGGDRRGRKEKKVPKKTSVFRQNEEEVFIGKGTTLARSQDSKSCSTLTLGNRPSRGKRCTGVRPKKRSGISIVQKLKYTKEEVKGTCLDPFGIQAFRLGPSSGGVAEAR